MPSESKPFVYITEATLISAIDTDPHIPENEGKFMLEGRVVIYPDNLFKPGDPIRTSILVKVDIEKGWFETVNSVYVVIPTTSEAVYRMTDPT